MPRYAVAASLLAALLLVAGYVLTRPAVQSVPAASSQATHSSYTDKGIRSTAIPSTPAPTLEPPDTETGQMKAEGLQAVLNRTQGDTRMTLYADVPLQQTRTSPDSRPGVSKIILRVASGNGHRTIVVDADRIADASALVLLTDNGRNTKRFNVIAAVQGSETYPDLQVIAPPSLRIGRP